jgi:hypothetical protein
MIKVKHNCSDCKHRQDVFVPCEWIKKKKHIVLACPYYEKEK